MLASSIPISRAKPCQGDHICYSHSSEAHGGHSRAKLSSHLDMEVWVIKICSFLGYHNTEISLSKLIHMLSLFFNIHPRKYLSTIEPYSPRIWFVFVTGRLRFRIRIRTLSAPTPNPEKIRLQTWFQYYSTVFAPFSPLVVTHVRRRPPEIFQWKNQVATWTWKYELLKYSLS